MRAANGPSAYARDASLAETLEADRERIQKPTEPTHLQPENRLFGQSLVERNIPQA